VTTPQDRLTIEGLRQTVADLRERRCDFECLICKPTASFPSNCDHIALIAWLRQKAIDAYGDLAHCERSWEDAGKEIAALKALVKEMIHHECRDGDRPFYHLWKGSEWEQEDLSILIGAMFK